MSATRTPKWLQAALEAHQPSEGMASGTSWPRQPRPGDICLLEGVDGIESPRLVLVTTTDRSRGTATVVLVTNEVELAGVRDVRLDTAATGLGYTMLAELDVAGVAWWAQLSVPLGQLDEGSPSRNAILHRKADDVAPGLRGMPIVSRADSRWQWKENEAAALGSVTADCAQSLLEDSEPLIVIDDGLLATNPESGWDAVRDIESVLDLLARSTAPVEPGALADIPDPRNLLHAGLGIDAVTAMSAAVLKRQRARTRSEPTTTDFAASAGVWSPPRRGDERVSLALNERLLRLAEAGYRSVQLATGSHLWEAGEGSADVAVLQVRKQRVQVIPLTRSEKRAA